MTSPQSTIAADAGVPAFTRPTLLQVLMKYAAALAATLGAFVVYDFAVVPWIEPPARIAQRPEIDPLPYYPRTEASESDLQRLFDADAWERGNPKILRTDQGVLLFLDYQTQDDGRLDLKPVTLIVPLSRSSGEPSRQIVLQAPDGAELQFDGSLTIAGQSGRLVGGKLRGAITVWSPESRAGAGDDLWAKTENVRIQPDRIETTSSVEFRFGEHYGSGRHLLVGLAPQSGSAETQRFGVGTARSIELVHVDKVRLLMPGRRGLLGSAPKSTAAADPQRIRPPSQKTPVDLTCQGSFQFDLQEYVASFEKQVNLVRLDPTGLRDQLSCDFLAIHFARRGGAAGDRGEKSDRAGSSAIERIVSRGAPILLRAPSQDIDARAQQFEYDLPTRTITLNDPHQVMLRRGDQLVEAPRLKYVMATEEGRLGQLHAPGPGLFRGRPRRDGALITATWKKEIRLEPQDERHVLSLLSGVQLESDELGRFHSEELHLWMREVPKNEPRNAEKGSQGARYELLPEQLLATGTVRFDSPRLAGVTERVEIRIDHLAAARPRVEDASPPPTRDTRGDTFGLVSDSGSAAEPARKFELTAETIKLHLLLQGQQQQIEQAYLGPGAQVVEVSHVAGRMPLKMVGSSFELSGGSSANPRIVLRGWPAKRDARGTVVTKPRPASVSAEGLTLVGPDIHVDQGENRVWIEGPGEMHAVSALGRTPGRVRVTWRTDFDFDGQTATARDDVHVRGRYTLEDGEWLDFVASGPELEATLTARLNLRQPDSKQRTAAQRLLFRGPVVAESRTFAMPGEASDESPGVQRSFEHMQVTNLEVDQVTGRLHADGPGSVSSVRFAQGLARTGQARVVFEADQRPSRLFYLKVDYNREIVGNVLNREVSFLNHVRATYGPVAGWGEQVAAEQVTGRRREGAVLTCQQLSVAEMGTRQEPSLELDASGNTHVEGQESRGYFTATGHHLKYVQNKDLMILEGDGRNDAVVSVQEGIGAPPQTTRLRRIVFQPRTGDVQLDGLNSVDYRDNRPPTRPPRSSALPPARIPPGRYPIGYR